MEAFIYFAEASGHDLDELEEAIDAALCGIGEVSGSGTGAAGSNLDIFVYGNTENKHELVNLLRESLGSFVLPLDSSIVVEGQRFPRYP